MESDKKLTIKRLQHHSLVFLYSTTGENKKKMRQQAVFSYAALTMVRVSTKTSLAVYFNNSFRKDI